VKSIKSIESEGRGGGGGGTLRSVLTGEERERDETFKGSPFPSSSLHDCVSLLGGGKLASNIAFLVPSVVEEVGDGVEARRRSEISFFKIDFFTRSIDFILLLSKAKTGR
jgi:hypothetical protein